jgi:hypothetical protein
MRHGTPITLAEISQQDEIRESYRKDRKSIRRERLARR